MNRLKLTAPLLVLFATAIFLFLAATNIQGGWLYFVDALLWSVVLVGALLPLLQIRSVLISRQLKSKAVVKHPVTLETRLQAGGKLPLSFINLTEYVPVAYRAGDMSGSTTSKRTAPEVLDKSFVEILKRGDTHIQSTRFVPELPGIHVMEMAQTGSFGPLGLMGVYKKQHSPFAFVVHPVAPEGSLKALSPDQLVALKHAHQRSLQQEDISHFREYQAGDSRRQIHWRNTARRQSLVVGEARQEPLQRAALWVDIHKNQPRETALKIMEQAAIVGNMLLAEDLVLDSFAPPAHEPFWEKLALLPPQREISSLKSWESLSPWLAHLEQDAPEGFQVFPLEKSKAVLHVVITDRLSESFVQHVATGHLSVLCFTWESNQWTTQTL